MKILMPVSYNAPRSGLLDHIRALAIAAPLHGNCVTVVGKQSVFLDELTEHAVDTIALDLSETERAAEALRTHATKWDLVHAHPFRARKVGLAVAQALDIPAIVTIHGWYDDDIADWIDDVAAVIAVSPAIARNLSSITAGAAAKIVTIPNGTRLASVAPRPLASPTPPYCIAVASRIDGDFTRLSDILRDFIVAAQDAEDARWQIHVAGAGTHLERERRKFGDLAQAAAGPAVTFLGWLAPDELRELYGKSFAAVAPGRSAVDAMASGIPTVMTRQVGTYSPLVDFGPMSHYDGSPNGGLDGRDLYSRLSTLAEEPAAWLSLSTHLSKAAQLFYDDLSWQRITNGLYEFVVAGHKAKPLAAPRRSQK